MKKSFFLLLIFYCCTSLYAQEEIYDETKIQKRPRVQNEEEQPQNNSSSSGKKIKAVDENMEDSTRKKIDLSKLRIGGNFGLQIGSYTFINLSPTVGYLFLKDRLEAGAGPILIFQSIRYSNSFRQRSFVYGSSLYARGYVWRGVFAQAQYDFVNKDSYFVLNNRVNVHHLLIGAGYAQQIGNAGAFFVSLMYDVINNDESIYQGTFGRIPLMLNMGFGFGIGRGSR